jgi:hypothetical protein
LSGDQNPTQKLERESQLKKEAEAGRRRRRRGGCKKLYSFAARKARKGKKEVGL